MASPGTVWQWIDFPVHNECSFSLSCFCYLGSIYIIKLGWRPLGGCWRKNKTFAWSQGFFHSFISGLFGASLLSRAFASTHFTLQRLAVVHLLSPIFHYTTDFTYLNNCFIVKSHIFLRAFDKCVRLFEDWVWYWRKKFLQIILLKHDMYMMKINSCIVSFSSRH